MKIYKCVIIEDDIAEQKILQTHLKKLNHLEIVNTFVNPVDALGLLQTQQIDILFSDIELPEINGIELIKSLANPPKVIFFTSHSNYAVEAFEYGVTDYLVKPYSFERLIKAVSRALDKSDLESVKIREENEVIFLKSGRDMLKFNLNQILYIEALGSFTKVYTQDKVSVISEAISILQDKLNNEFIRVHKSYLVSKKKVTGISAKNVLVEDKKIPLGVSYRESVEKIINGD
ncbi:MAG: LytTR family DNA-binding domain-containing protein [Spirosomaceae bacterium]|jgi:DNA-binding LytR/AlgR family response regulator|nr:LytTR family DNA-binding domain-containing protein [Spirosomataceae bacterium]